jgi:hypothetical protein
MNTNIARLFFALTLSLGLILALVGVLAVGTRDVSRAQSGTGIICVATSGTDVPSCGNASSPCLTLQYAVDQALPGEEIRVASGVYTGVQGRMTFAGYPGPGYPGSSLITQVLYITKTLAVRGGFTTTNAFAGPPDPVANPTTLDAQGQGRVLVILGDPSGAPEQAISPTVEGLRITGGDASGLGGDPSGRDAAGGIGVIAAAVTISDCEVFSNTAAVAGGIGLGFDQSTLRGNIIRENSADVDGGGVGLSSSYATLIGNSVVANIALHDGGGIASTGSDGITLIENNVISNTAYAGGGGIYMDTSTATLEANTVVSNTSVDLGGGEGGGGLYLWNSTATLSSTSVISNAAAWYGGGMFLGGDSGSQATLVNSVIANNRADIAGGGLYIEDSSLRSLHATIARNVGGDGSGVYVTGYHPGQHSSAALTNTILVSHTIGIYVTNGSTATLEATFWGSGAWANIADTVGAVISTTNVTGNPMFVNPNAGDYHIGSTSQAIDMGVNAGITVDIDGESRPAGSSYDIGADEFWWKVYLPLVLRQ